jgi:hypothetical protein
MNKDQKLSNPESNTSSLETFRILNISVCPEHLRGYIVPWIGQLMEEKSVFSEISCVMILVPHMLTVESGNFFTTNHTSLCDSATSRDK